MKRSLVAAAAVVLIASCGGGGDSSEPTASARSFPTLASLVSSIGDVGCELAEVEPVEGYDIDEQAECADASVRVYTFNSTISERQVVDAILEIDGRFAVDGDLWAAETNSRELAEEIRTAIGGTVRS